jgi:hypothetical protein
MEDVSMAQYHFEIVDGFRLADPAGLDCKSEKQARQVAEDIARQIAIDVGETSARKVVVVDEDGSEIYTTPIKS